jgi:hypothetical protein
MKAFHLPLLALVAAFCTAAPATSAGPAASIEAPANAAYSAAGLYNLANSYARAGKPGMAVLNYERADLLAPNDADIQANLKHLRSSLHLPIAAGSKLERIARLAGPTRVAWIAVLGVLIAGASLLSARLFPRRRSAWIAGACLSIAALGFTVCNAIYWGPKIHEAVVIAATTSIRATPVPMGDPLQQLSEAETVTVAQSHEEFVLVRTLAGRSGWVARADLADVVPETSVR